MLSIMCFLSEEPTLVGLITTKGFCIPLVLLPIDLMALQTGK